MQTEANRQADEATPANPGQPLLDEDMKARLDEAIARCGKRETMLSMIPEGTRRILDIGCGDGGILLRLKRHKGCSELYGIEISPQPHLTDLLDGLWSNMFPQEPLDDRYVGHFNYILMHDVIEHIVDPWLFLSHVRRYLAPGGKLIMATPNMQHWDIMHALMNGDFPYGCGGLMNETHLRWFTMKSFIETAILGGLNVEQAAFMIWRAVTNDDVTAIQNPADKKTITLPPSGQKAGVRFNPFPSMNLMYPFEKVEMRFTHEVDQLAVQHLATKLLLVCTNNPEQPDAPPVRVGSLNKLRQECRERYGKALKKLEPQQVLLLVDA